MTSQDPLAPPQKLDGPSSEARLSLKSIDEIDLYDFSQIHQKAAVYRISNSNSFSEKSGECVKQILLGSSQDIKLLNDKLQTLCQTKPEGSSQHSKSKSLSGNRPKLTPRSSAYRKLSDSKSPLTTADHSHTQSLVILTKKQSDPTSLDADQGGRQQHPRNFDIPVKENTVPSKDKHCEDVGQRKSSSHRSWYENEEHDHVLEDFLFGNGSQSRSRAMSKHSIILDYEPERGSFEIPCNGKTLTNTVLSEVRGTSSHEDGRNCKPASRKESIVLEKISAATNQEDDSLNPCEDVIDEKPANAEKHVRIPTEDWTDGVLGENNENKAQDARLEESQENSHRKKSWHSRLSWNIVHTLDDPSNVLLGITRLQLLTQKIIFKSSNSCFQTLKSIPRGINTTALIDAMPSTIHHTPRGFSVTKVTCGSLVLDKHQEAHLVTSTVRNIANRRVQDIFNRLRMSASIRKVKYETSIISGVTTLSKLLGARERSLYAQSFSVWKLRHCLEKQRDMEMAAKESKIQQLRREKHDILLELSKAQENGVQNHVMRCLQATDDEIFPEEADTNKENVHKNTAPNKQSPKNTATATKTSSSAILNRKSYDGVEQQQLDVNQKLIDKLKELYEQEDSSIFDGRYIMESRRSLGKQDYHRHFNLGHPDYDDTPQEQEFNAENRPPLRGVFDRDTIPVDLKGVRSSLSGALHKRCDKEHAVGSHAPAMRSV